jgi:hypothetical protein
MKKILLIIALALVTFSCKKEIIQPRLNNGSTLELKIDELNPVVKLEYTIKYTNINGVTQETSSKAVNVDFTKEIKVIGKSGFDVISDDSTYWHPAEMNYKLYKDNLLIDSKKGTTYTFIK